MQEILEELKKSNAEAAALRQSVTRALDLFEKTAQDVQILKNKCALLEKENIVLNKEIQYLKRYNRKNNCILFNVPEDENEMVLEKTKNIISDCGVNVQDASIDKCFRLGKKKDKNHSRPILLALNSYLVKQKIMEKREIFNSKSYSVKHDKSPEDREEARNIYNSLLKLKVLDHMASFKNGLYKVNGRHYNQEECNKMIMSLNNEEKENISKRKKPENDEDTQPNIHPFFRTRASSNSNTSLSTKQ